MIELQHNAKERILAISLDIIGKKGIDALSVREIAAKANVNIASINYYFKSKDNLIHECFEHFEEKIQSVFEILDDITIPPSERLRQFLYTYIDTLHIRYPGIIKSQIKQMMQSEYEVPHDSQRSFTLIDVLQKHIDSLRQIVVEITGNPDDVFVATKVVQVLTNLSHPIFFTKLIQQNFGLDYQNEEFKKRYVDEIVSTVFTQEFVADQVKEQLVL